MITDRDKLIINYFERYKYATVEQIKKTFFQEQQYSYGIAIRRLRRIRDAGYIKVHRDIETNKNIYIWTEGKIKPPGTHRILLLNLLAELQYQGFDVEVFEIEKQWQGGAVRSDALLIFKVDNGTGDPRRYHFFVEVHLSNNNVNLDKYDILYKTNEVQQYIGKDFFPRVLVISDKPINTGGLRHTKYVKINTKLDLLSTILLTN